MASQLVWFELPVADVDRAQAFYGELLEWRFEPFGGPDYQMVREAQPGGALTAGEPGSATVYFASENLDAALQRVRELGGHADEPLDIPGVGRMAHCRDDQGTRFSLYQPAAGS